jgi:hypothetical protein
MRCARLEDGKANLERPMKLFAEISAGELIDKVTILEIKRDKISDEAKRTNISREYAVLVDVLDRELEANDEIRRLRLELKAVNEELWRIEDDIRIQEQAQTFGAEFIALARSVYKKNDLRARLKRQINLSTKSNIVEEKSYSNY